MKKLIILLVSTAVILSIGVGCTKSPEENISTDNPAKDITQEETSEVIKNEIIITVTSDYDGTITDELKALNVISVENIFDVEDTIMYLIKTDIYVDDIITKLEELSYVKHAEYNMLIEYIDPILEAQ